MNRKYKQGEWLEGVMHGKGVFNWFKEKKKYEGEYKDGVKHGKGKLSQPDGSMYDGLWLDGFQHGKNIIK